MQYLYRCPRALTQHYFIENPCLPYRTFISPTDKTPSWTSGSSNLLTSLKGYVERRPGFATAVEGTPTTFTGQIVSQFTWRKWGGSFYTMVNEVTGTDSKVYSFQHGTSTSFTLLHTASATTNPFGFVESNNTVYFGNGVAGNMKKWDGTTSQLGDYRTIGSGYGFNHRDRNLGSRGILLCLYLLQHKYRT
jgi:hypothetical protein